PDDGPRPRSLREDPPQVQVKPAGIRTQVHPSSSLTNRLESFLFLKRLASKLTFLYLLLLLLACTGQGKETKGLPSTTGPSFEPQFASIPVPPDADLYELARRFRLEPSGSVPRLNRETFPTLGATDTFWVTNLRTLEHSRVRAVLRHISPHAYFYVAEDARVSDEDIQKAADSFENRAYPTGTRYFGSAKDVAASSDRLTILNASVPGVGGYYSSADEYPRLINPYSNERQMLYMNIDALAMGSPEYTAVVAHELQHAIHWIADPTEETWVNEGLSELAADALGYPSQFASSFLRKPDVQLTSWDEDDAAAASHYGASYLFIKYLSQRYGGLDRVGGLVKEPANGAAGISAYLKREGYSEDFGDVYKGWVIANYISSSTSDPRFKYDGIRVRAEPVDTIVSSTTRPGTVHQYAADYFDIEPSAPADATVTFEGAPVVKVLPNDAKSGSFQWWSNRGDSIDTTLTRSFDLSRLSKATLSYWAWYDLEDGWDYAYVEVSTDEGKSWKILPGQHTTDKNPVGNSYGPGYTGRSGQGRTPSWIQEAVDLSLYAGGRILVRFESVSDEAVNKNGFAVDDITILELGYTDDAETDGGWQAEGFVRTNNLLKETFAVYLIAFGDGVEVREVPLSASQRGTAEVKGLGQSLKKATLVITALAPVTTQEATYQFTVDIRPSS
ncbi:MAG TPA: hypothetical protein VJM51_07925, partial [Dehalococcoidia bacterium]|nr:hypothetical protein [Dehalococcoidia bacterium]